VLVGLLGKQVVSCGGSNRNTASATAKQQQQQQQSISWRVLTGLGEQVVGYGGINTASCQAAGSS
jgi:hypothetical protein